MRNRSDKSCRENQNTHFRFNTSFFFFSKIVLFVRWCGKTLSSRAGHGWHFNTAQKRKSICVKDKARVQTPAHNIDNYFFSTATMVTRMHPVLRYTCNACLVCRLYNVDASTSVSQTEWCRMTGRLVNCEFENSSERMRPWAIFRYRPVVCVTTQVGTGVVPSTRQNVLLLKRLARYSGYWPHSVLAIFFSLCCVRLCCVGRGLQRTDPLSEKPRAVSKDSAVHN
jgi:hypothetical protein